jgi:hypothetical protein
MDNFMDELILLCSVQMKQRKCMQLFEKSIAFPKETVRSGITYFKETVATKC